MLDPFAGGSVRGIVAGMLGRRYIGVELRPEQIAANAQQRKDLCRGADVQWLAGDARDVGTLLPKTEQADFVFSCPPYGDLEQYSDDPRDLSNMPAAAFLAAYRAIVAAACARLRTDRFACFVVGDYRDKKTTAYRNFPAATTDAFAAAGLALYNEAVLVTAVGSLPLRAGGAFSGSRKLGKTHQNVLVYVKGDAKRAAAACGEVETAMPEAQ